MSWYMLEGYADPKRVDKAYAAVTAKWNWFEEQDSELWDLVKAHKAREVAAFELPVEKHCEHEEGDPACQHGWPPWFCDQVRELLEELAETMEIEEEDYRDTEEAEE